jgi:PEP-CTERM motif
MKPVFQALAVAFLLVSGAQAALTQSFDTATPAGAIDYSFDDLAGNSLLSISGGSIKTGDTPNINSQPQGGIGNYWSLDPSVPGFTSPGTITFSTLMSQVSFLWGSPDSFNSLVVHRAGGADLVINPFATGGVNSNSRYLTLTSLGSDWITGLTFSSQVNLQSYAFEVDNLRVTAVPEPETYALMLAGLGLMGFIARRRRPQQ